MYIRSIQLYKYTNKKFFSVPIIFFFSFFNKDNKYFWIKITNYLAKPSVYMFLGNAFSLFLINFLFLNFARFSPKKKEEILDKKWIFRFYWPKFSKIRNKSKFEKTFPWYIYLDHEDGFGKFLKFFWSKNISFILVKKGAKTLFLPISKKYTF